MSWFSRLRNTFRARPLDSELRDEMADHLHRRAEALRENGMSAEQAEREARLRFGNITQIKEKSREIRLASVLESTFQDVRYAWRGMRKSPAFAITAILSLALAIGANTAIYSIVDAALLRPLPVPEPDRLFTLAYPGIQEPGRESEGERDSFNYPLYQKFRDAAGDSARLALFNSPLVVEAQIPGAHSPVEQAPIENLTRQFVSGEAFEILKVQPVLGRVFSKDEDRAPGAHPVVVISYDYWQRRFQGNPAVLGQRMRSWGKDYTVVGVAPQGFFGVELGKFVDVWIPAMMYNSGPAYTNPLWNWFKILGRFAPGVASAQLQPRLQPFLRDSMEEWFRLFPTMPPAIKEQFRAAQLRVHPGASGFSAFRQTFARPLWIVLGVAAGVLLIACANVASLLLARSTARSAEMAMRVSLGAGRSRLIRQLLAESLLLSAVAGALGWVFARASAPVLVAMLSKPEEPVRFALAMDTRVLLFCAAVSTLAAVFFGLLPAWKASGAQPMRELHGIRIQAGKLRMGRFFVGVQVAFAFCLVIGGASFLFSLRNLLAVDTGLDPNNVSIVNISTELSDMTQKHEINLFLDEIQQRVAALPGIQNAATAAWMGFFDGRSSATQVILPGQTPSEAEEVALGVSPGYFATLRIPLLAGRDFEPRDREPRPGEPNANIVNQAFARRYFPGENPVGKIFQTPYEKTFVNHRIVGVVANSRHGSLREGVEPILYGAVREASYAALYVRSPLDLGSVVKMIEREAQAIGHGTRVREVTTLNTRIGTTILREKLLAGIGGVFAFLGLLLAAIGLFGLLNYSVTRRTKEIGIRAALGARPPALVFLVLRDMFSMIAGGLIVGLAGSLALMTFVRSLLFGVRTLDPLVMATAAAVFLVAAFIAGGLPASRAASIDPMIALRHE
jgi:predicted permease